MYVRVRQEFVDPSPLLTMTTTTTGGKPFCYPLLRFVLLLLVLKIQPTISWQYPQLVRRQVVGNNFNSLHRRSILASGSITSELNMSNNQGSALINGETASSSSSASPLHQRLLSTIGATTSLVVSGPFFIVLAYKRDAFMIAFFIGSILNAVLSKVLKKLLNQERPPELQMADLKLKPNDKGMPSSHAMSLGFIGTFTALSLSWTPIPIAVYVLLSLWYRVQTNLHTIEQVSVGLVIGTLNGAIWRLYLFDGSNPYGINVMDWVSTTLLNESGVLPWPMLIVPAAVGAIVVGSLERRISSWIKTRKKNA